MQKAILSLLWLCSSIFVAGQDLSEFVAKSRTVVKCVKQEDGRWQPTVLKAPEVIPRKEYPQYGAIFTIHGRTAPDDCGAYYYVDLPTGPRSSRIKILHLVKGQAQWKEAGQVHTISEKDLDALVVRALKNAGDKE